MLNFNFLTFLTTCCLALPEKPNLQARGNTIDIYPGDIWPKPFLMQSSPEFIQINTDNLSVNVKPGCDVVDHAISRFLKFLPTSPKLRFSAQQVTLTVELESCGENFQNSKTQENYELTINDAHIRIKAPNKFAANYAFTSLEQLLWRPNSQNWHVPIFQKYHKYQFVNLNKTFILDKPYLKYRGIMIDTSRHFLPVPVIKRQIELMRINKFNVLHWHMTDDEAFPFTSQKLPALLSPWRKDAVYTVEDLKNIVEFAKFHNVRIIPEFDSPGHMKSWAKVSPNFLSRCDNFQHFFSTPINPVLEENYQILTTLFAELREILQDDYFHIGGDEVAKDCWDHDPSILDFKHKNNLTNPQLESLYLKKLFKIIQKVDFNPIAWEEVWDNEYADKMKHNDTTPMTLNRDTLIHIWKDWTYKKVLPKVIETGYKPILSAPWYICYISYGEGLWKHAYAVNLTEHHDFATGESKIFGGEACMWAGYSDETNTEQEMWPSASAVGERIWSNPEEVKPSDHTRARFGWFRCYMRLLGYWPYPTWPNGPCYDESMHDEL